MRIGVISLGCAKNQVDTERMLGLLRRFGYDFTSDPAEAEVLIVNTCGFIDPAKEESINTILEMAQYKDRGRCLAASSAASSSFIAAASSSSIREKRSLSSTWFRKCTVLSPLSSRSMIR